MIELTQTDSLYPVRVPPGPSLWGRWTIVALILVVGVWVLLVKQKEKPETTENSDIQAVPELDLSLRLRQLQEINTSLRTPEQKIRALVIHLFKYIGIEHHDLSTASLTLAQIEHIDESEIIRPVLKQVYSLIYTEQKVTHSSINDIIKDLLTLLSGH